MTDQEYEHVQGDNMPSLADFFFINEWLHPFQHRTLLLIFVALFTLFKSNIRF
jgi:hypothetical protein